MKPTPMTVYTTATSARVMPPVAAPKPALYAGRVAELVATGLTAADAMQQIERKSGFRALSPPTNAGNQGSVRKKRPMSKQRAAALACLTAELTRAVPVVMKALAVHADNARSLLCWMVADGLAVSETVGRVAMWRRV